ncbi:MAG: LysR family transcriptional regulator [Proteobacteria bacterium]|jgi:DNA-binding transcriptional LysR family regulator|nr:LysR family transcriptional regulator [Pseudomonadota bacterium]
MSTPIAPSLDHLRILTAIVDAGSFSAAARQLDRSQPAISYGIAALEEQLGLTLFQRGKRKPILTPAGLAVLAYARRLCQLTDELTASASSLTAGLEGQFVLGVDTFFPEGQLAAALADLAESLPSVSIDVRVRSRDQVLRLVMDGQAALGVGAVDIAWPAGIEARDFGRVEIVAVVAPSHALARHVGRIPTGAVRDSLQITNRAAGDEDETRDVSINSSRLWRVGSLSLQVELLRRGLGWGYLPVHVAQGQIRAGHLMQLDPATRRRGVQPWSLMYRAAKPPGPAGRLLMERLEHHARDQEI